MDELNQLLRQLQPRLNPGVYVFCILQKDTAIPEGTISWFVEAEGISVILPVEVAERSGLAVGFQTEWITLEVQSDLAVVGLTAAVSGVLAKAGISCNVLAGYHHDHLFVQRVRGKSLSAFCGNCKCKQFDLLLVLL